MTGKIIAGAVILLLLAACATPRKELDTNPPFSSHYYRYYDLEILWKSARTDNVISIEGTVRNLRYYYLRDLELTASLLDDKGEVVAKETFASFPTLLDTSGSERFRLELRLKPGEAPRRIRFSYTYQLADTYQLPGYPRGDVPRFNSFESNL
ncbi:MAG: hypothetical protein NDI77_02425 [Geobacteraceae bacterium]|nr:hypothetical protein [Geobacteraceae bacterium]